MESGVTLGPGDDNIIPQKVFVRSFCKSQFPHKSVNLFFRLVIKKDNLIDLCGN